MILAADLGSSRFKAGLFDETLREVRSGGASVPYVRAQKGQVEITAPEALAAFREALGPCLAEGSAAAVQAVGITSQAQTFTVLDQNGRPVMPFLSWQDTRAAEACGELRRNPGLPDLAEHCSFGDLLPGLQLAQLWRLRKSGAQRGAHPGPTEWSRVVHLPSFFLLLLGCGDAVDENLAAMSGLYSLKSRSWWPAALEAAGISVAQLSRVIPLGGAAGTTGPEAAALGLPAGVPVILAGNDQTAGAYDAGIHRDGALLVTLGTAQVAYAVAEELPAPDCELVRGPYLGGLFYRMAADGCGGSVVDWARAVLSGCETEEAFFSLASASPAGSRGAVFDPGLPGGKGAWRNLGLNHVPADLARAVLESLCRRMAGMVHRVAGKARPSKVYVAGGGSRSPLWRDILSDSLGCPVERTEASALRGAARMAQGALAGRLP